MSGHPNLNLGEIIRTPQNKDAIHVAIAPVVAGEKLKPGTHVIIRTDGVIVAGPAADCIGIVDPFLRVPVLEGQRCWLFVYPNTVTSLRHEWTHPRFPNLQAWEKFTGASENKIREIAQDLGMTFDELIQGATEWIADGTRMSDGGRFEGFQLPEEFWEHYEKYTGKVVPAEKVQRSIFSCSC